MMTTTAFDTLASVKELKSAGFNEAQAEALTHALHKVANDDHLTTREQLDTRLRELELRLTVKIGAMVMALGGFLLAIKYWG